MDSTSVQAIPDERMYMAAAVLAQGQLVERMQNLTPKMVQYLKFRMLTGSDAAAMHLYGHPRPDGDGTKKCACGVHAPNWIDLRVQTVWHWKKNEDFRFVYETMLREPLLFASTRLEQLSLAAVSTYEDILSPNSTAKDSVRRLAARDMLQSNHLLDVEGVNKSSRPGQNVVESMALRMAKERMSRGLELSIGQRTMLKEAGYTPPESQQMQITMGTERSLDGTDVAEYDDATMLPD